MQNAIYKERPDTGRVLKKYFGLAATSADEISQQRHSFALSISLWLAHH